MTKQGQERVGRLVAGVHKGQWEPPVRSGRASWRKGYTQRMKVPLAREERGTLFQEERRAGAKGGR